MVNNFLFSQTIVPSVSNYLRYGTGYENVGEGGFVAKKNKEYFENTTDARLFFKDVTIGFRLEVSDPPEYGITYRGLRKKYIEFSQDNLSVRAGDLYALFNRGLALNLFENRPLAYDAGIEGVKAQYRDRVIDATILGGELDFIEPVSVNIPPLRKDSYTVRAANGMISPLKNISIGGSFVWVKSIQQSLIDFDTIVTHLPELSTSIQFLGFDVFGSYTFKRTNINRTDSSKGKALYTAISYTGKGYGVTFEYKNYSFDLVDPLQRSFNFRPTRMLPFQNPPIVNKEHSFTLLSRNPHIIDFNDEVGFQVDGFYSVSDNITLNLNIASASRHDAYISENYVPVKMQKGKKWLPSSAEERSPFWEIYFEAEYSFDESESYLKIAFDRRAEIQYEIFAPVPKQSQRFTSLPFLIQYVFDEMWSVKLTSESQWLYKFPHDKREYTHLVSFQLAHSPGISAGFRYETTTSKYEPENKKDWLAVEGSYQIGESHSIGISYGAERGGQVCSNGICRTVNPFNGFKFTMTSNF